MTIRERLCSETHLVYLDAWRELAGEPRAEAVAVLRDIAQSASGLVQARILNPLRHYDPEAANELAIRILDVSDSNFHPSALYSLWATRCSSGIGRACRILLTHPDQYARLGAATYLGECGTREQIPVLKQALDDRGTDEEGRTVSEVAEMAIVTIEEANPVM